MRVRTITLTRRRGYFATMRKLVVVLQMDWGRIRPFDLDAMQDGGSATIVTRFAHPLQCFGIGGVPFVIKVRRDHI